MERGIVFKVVHLSLLSPSKPHHILFKSAVREFFMLSEEGFFFLGSFTERQAASVKLQADTDETEFDFYRAVLKSVSGASQLQ